MKRIFLSAVLTCICTASAWANTEPVDMVNPLTGTLSKFELSTGNNYPVIALPWGMNFWTPQTGKNGDGWQYTYTADKIRGFKQTHQPSPWMNDYGMFSLMPITGEAVFDEDKRASWFSHKAEIAKPYYYRVYLADYDITTEIAPTERAAMFRFTFPQEEMSYVVLDAYDRGSYVQIQPEKNRIVGYTTRNSGGVTKDFKNWFIIDFGSRSFDYTSVTDSKEIFTDRKELKDNHTGAIVGFRTRHRDVITARVASSFISLEQAERNLNELGKKSFDEIASDGRKMSKSLRNYTDPVEAINKFGADAIRLFLMHSAVVKADEIRYSDDGVREVLKSIIIPLWNSYSFFVTYANIDGITCTGHAFDNKLPENPLDCWLLSVTQSLVKKVTEAMEQYDLSGAIDPIVDFIDQLNNWYIRRSRRRFWKSENDGDKTEAYETLYTALKTFAKVAAPFVPFITEEMWQNLKTAEDKESVHLEDYPVYNERFHNEKLEFKMNTVQKAISMGRSLRNQFNLKNRQPLASVALVTRNSEEKTVLAEMLDSIKEELNVKNVIFHEREDELVEYKAKANFKVLGKELGALMKDAASKIIALEQSAIQSILDGSKLTIEVGDKTVDLTEEKIIVDRIEKEDVKVINEGTLTVGLDTKITDELKKEGYVRDLVRGIQNLRKDSGFEVTDRIKLTVGGDAELKAAFEIFADFIKSETLAVEAAWVDSIDGATSVEADDKTWSIKVEKK